MTYARKRPNGGKKITAQHNLQKGRLFHSNADSEEKSIPTQDPVERLNEETAVARHSSLILTTAMGLALAHVPAINHKDILLDRALIIPILETEVPVSLFFVGLPLLLFVLHFAALLQHAIYSRRIAHFTRHHIKDFHIEDLAGYFFLRRRCMERSGENRGLRLALWIYEKIVFVIAPLYMLLLIQWRALAYHNESLIWWIRILVWMDILAILYLYYRISSAGLFDSIAAKKQRIFYASIKKEGPGSWKERFYRFLQNKRLNFMVLMIGAIIIIYMIMQRKSLEFDLFVFDFFGVSVPPSSVMFFLLAIFSMAAAFFHDDGLENRPLLENRCITYFMVSRALSYIILVISGITLYLGHPDWLILLWSTAVALAFWSNFGSCHEKLWIDIVKLFANFSILMVAFILSIFLNIPANQETYKFVKHFYQKSNKDGKENSNTRTRKGLLEGWLLANDLCPFGKKHLPEQKGNGSTERKNGWRQMCGLTWYLTEQRGGILAYFNRNIVLIAEELGADQACHTCGRGDKSRKWSRLSLRNRDLRNAEFSMTNLHMADLTRADLEGARLDRSQMTDATLDKWPGCNPKGWENGDKKRIEYRMVDLAGANLRNASLSCILLREADLRGADLSGANLQGSRFERVQVNPETSFRNAKMQGFEVDDAASWKKVNLSGTDLSHAALEGVDFTGSHLEGANFTGATLTGAYFTGSHLEGAKFIGAVLTDANFTRARLIAANFQEADLRGAKFYESWLHGANFFKAKLNADTEFKEVGLFATRLSDAQLQKATFKSISILISANRRKGWDQIYPLNFDKGRGVNCVYVMDEQKGQIYPDETLSQEACRNDNNNGQNDNMSLQQIKEILKEKPFSSINANCKDLKKWTIKVAKCELEKIAKILPIQE